MTYLGRTSFKAMVSCLRVALVLLALNGLTACATRPGPDVLQPTSEPQESRTSINLLAVTNRRFDAALAAYGSDRAQEMSFQRFKVGFRQSHRPGSVAYPDGPNDKDAPMAIENSSNLSRRAFVGAVEDAASDGRVEVFVHGFNYSYQEAVYRLAQLHADSGAKGEPILFSWPSAALGLGYIADREAALASRDALTDLLIELASAPRVREISVLGHSMGGFLTIESLRQLRIAGRADVISKLNVTLAAPDIDLDVMLAGMELIGILNPPVTLLVSPDDTALAVSSFLRLSRPRVGNLGADDPDLAALALKLGLRVVDISAIDDTEGMGHDRYIGLAMQARQLVERERRQARSPASVGLFVLGSFDATLRQVVGAQ